MKPLLILLALCLASCAAKPASPGFVAAQQAFAMRMLGEVEK